LCVFYSLKSSSIHEQIENSEFKPAERKVISERNSNETSPPNISQRNFLSPLASYKMAQAGVQATSLPSWKALQAHHDSVGRSFVLKEAFASDPQRFSKFSHSFKNTSDSSEILFDFSKNLVTEETIKLLVQVAKEAKVEELRDAMFKGDKINTTEDRAVLHVALRNVDYKPIMVDGKDVMPGVKKELEHMKEFSEAIRSGEWKGFTGKPLTTIINIGIGGSDL
jgi:glucose-6-phosphate isomerase